VGKCVTALAYRSNHGTFALITTDRTHGPRIVMPVKERCQLFIPVISKNTLQ
jgi:hypothetical protein